MSAVLGGAALGAALAGVVLAVLGYVTLDACAHEQPIPAVFQVSVVAMGAVGLAALVRVVDARPRVPWLAAGVALVVAAAAHLALEQHRARAAADCTWIVNPAVPVR